MLVHSLATLPVPAPSFQATAPSQLHSLPFLHPSRMTDQLLHPLHPLPRVHRNTEVSLPFHMTSSTSSRACASLNASANHLAKKKTMTLLPSLHPPLHQHQNQLSQAHKRTFTSTQQPSISSVSNSIWQREMEIGIEVVRERSLTTFDEPS